MKWDGVNRRRAVVWGAWLVVLLAGLAGLFVWDSVRSYEAALREFETHVGSANHRDYMGDPVADDRNAALLFLAASAGVELGGEQLRVAEPAGWTPAMQASARELLDRSRLVLADMEAAAQRPGCVWHPVQPMDPGALLPLVRAASLVRLEGFVGVAEGDPERTKAAFRVLGSLAECLYASPRLAGLLIAIVAERARLEVVHAAVSSSDVDAGLLEYFDAELETIADVDRVRWAVASEGAFALLELDYGRLGDRAGWGPRVGSPSFRRMGAALALRWVEFARWSEQPLEVLVSGPAPADGPGLSVSGLVADMVTANLRDAVVRMRVNRALIDLARLAIRVRLHGLREGGYEAALAGREGLDVLSEGDGSVVLIDSDLDSLLRTYLDSLDESGARAQSALDLTVWRLPQPGPSER